MQGRLCEAAQDPERRRKRPEGRAAEDPDPVDALILNFWPAEQPDNTFLVFKRPGPWHSAEPILAN